MAIKFTLAAPFRAYLLLTKPGIVMGNVITATAGFLLASAGRPDPALGAAAIGALALVVAAACVLNNVIDRKLDTHMKRTKRRGPALQLVTPVGALIFTLLLTVAGFGLLAVYTNLLATLLALAGFIIYVIAYGITKRRSPAGTVVGSLAGATPPVIGYTAVTGRLDVAALVLFAILVLWQMPHFYSIALFRLDDYKAARVPVLPAVRGPRATKVYIMGYLLAFAIVAPLLTPLGYTSASYLAVAVILGLAWLWLGIQGFNAPSDKLWARRMFSLSLIVITTLSAMIALGHA
jgi:protoheme IX farnesyltransferase